VSLKAILGIVGGVLGVLGVVCGAIYFIEDRYVTEKEAVISIRQQQQMTDLHLIDLWREQRSVLEEACITNTGNISLKTRLERAKKNIDIIEKRLYVQ
jgi:5-bromo-4-chloroindolyl phosphate hydrolysis protein